jgi:hypothetical protein
MEQRMATGQWAVHALLAHGWRRQMSGWVEGLAPAAWWLGMSGRAQMGSVGAWPATMSHERRVRRWQCEAEAHRHKLGQAWWCGKTGGSGSLTETRRGTAATW